MRLALPILLALSFGLRLWVAQAGPDHRQTYDERFSVRNAARALDTGRPAPENGFHPSLSYLPHLLPMAASEAAFRLIGWRPLQILDRGPGNEIGRRGAADGLLLTPTGYLLARGVNCLVGTLTILLCFAVARRMFDERVALVAALLLASVPWHIRQSATFKPDIVLVAAFLLAFLWALVALERPRLGPWIVAGCGVGLAMSAKFNAAPAVIPLVAGSVFRLRRDRAVLWLLPAAGLAAIVTFLLLNPWVLVDFGVYEHDFGATLRDYARKGRIAEATRGQMLASVPQWLLGGLFHGRIVGALALAGVAGLLLSGLRRESAKRQPKLLLVSFVGGYVLIFVLFTQNPGGWHNWLALVPFTAIAAAWAMVGVWDLLRPRLPAVGRRPAAVLAVVALTLVTVPPAVRFAYRAAVPETWALARDRLREVLGNQGGRVVFQEVAVPPPLSFARGRSVKLALARVERLDRIGVARLDLADAELFGGNRLEGERLAFFAARAERLRPEQITRIRSGWLRGRGPEIWLLAHPFAAVGQSSWLELERLDRGRRPTFAARLPPAGRPGAPVSFGLWLAQDRAAEGAGAGLAVDGQPLRLILAQKSGEAGYYLSERIVPRRLRPRLVVKLDRAADETSYPVEVYRWRSPAG